MVLMLSAGAKEQCLFPQESGGR